MLTLTGFVADKFGRKGGLLLNNVFVVLASLFEGLARTAGSYHMLILGRFFIGINSGLNAGLAPMYLAEISPINLRGAIGTVYQLVVTISILVAQILGLPSILGTHEGWPVLLALTIVPAIFQVRCTAHAYGFLQNIYNFFLQMVTLPCCPESPKYLLSVGKEMDAQRGLSWLRCSNNVNEEMDQMRAEYDAVKLIPKVTMRELITNSALRIPLIICLTIMVAQQLSGINAVSKLLFC